jgi:hypothetical protein
VQLGWGPWMLAVVLLLKRAAGGVPARSGPPAAFGPAYGLTPLPDSAAMRSDLI